MVAIFEVVPVIAILEVVPNDVNKVGEVAGPGRKLVNTVNPLLTNGFFHHYHLGESTFIYRGIRSDFQFYPIFR